MMDMVSQNPLIVSVVIAVVVLALMALVGFVVFSGQEKRKAKNRIGRVQNRPPERSKIEAKAKQMRLTKVDSKADTLASNLLPKPENMKDKLSKTGTEMSMGTFLTVCAVTAVASVAFYLLVLGLPLIAAILVGFASGLMLPYFYIGFLVGRRKKKFIKYFPDAIDVMVRGIKSGLPITEAFQVVGREMDGPVGEEFSKICDQIAFGKPLDDALWETASRVDVPEYRFFAITVSIQRETGGNLAETLGNLSDVLRKRGQVKLKVKAYSSEARASAYIIGSLPFLMFGIIYTINPDYVMQLLTDERGWMLLAAGGVSQGLGVGTMAKMVRFEI